MKALNPFEIDLHKTTLIEASAGTGKTYTITTLYCLLAAQGFLVESILVVTFTEAAAAELKLRIRDRLSFTLEKLQNKPDKNDDDLVSFFRKSPDLQQICQRLSLALTCFDQAAILTIHSFCLKILKENAFDSNFPFDIKLVPDNSVFLAQACYDFFAARVNYLEPLFLKYLSLKDVTPDKFLKSFSSVAMRKGIVINPKEEVFLDCFEEYKEEVSKIKTILSNQSDEIINLFLNHQGIDKRSYNKKNVPAWLKASCLKIEKEGLETLFKMSEKGDSLYKFTSSRVDEKTKKGSPPEHELFNSCQRLFELEKAFKNNLISLKLDFIQFFNKALENVKTQKGICFFDDLVNALALALEGPDSLQLKNAVQKMYQACLIDEFQDTDPVQYDIFSQLFARPNTPFFMIGDPKQAIYAFRGGDIFAYLKAVKQSNQSFTLEYNYRSAPLLVKGVNEIFSNAQNPFLFHEIDFLRVNTPKTAIDKFVQNNTKIAPLEFKFLKRSPSNVQKDGYISTKTAKSIIPGIVAKDILELLQSTAGLVQDSGCEPKNISPENIGILVRTNDQAQKIQQALEDLGIPSFLSKSGSVFDSTQAIDLYDILWALNHPDNKESVKAALCTGVFNFSATTVNELNEDENLLFYWQDMLRHYKNQWETNGFVSMIMSLFHSKEAFLKSNPGLNERKITNFYHLVELISQEDVAHNLSPYYLLKWYARQLSKDFRAEAADELRLESDKKAVAVVTIHKSKGLEYPVVYLPYMWEGLKRNLNQEILFHDPDKEHTLTLDIGSKDIEQSHTLFLKEEEAEQRRLLYVALTRASSMCRIFWAGFKNIEECALAKLIHSDGCTDDDSMLKDLEKIKQKAPESISIDLIDPSFYINTRDDSSQRTASIWHTTSKEKSVKFSKLSVKENFRKITPAWKMSSFSAITKNFDSFDLKSHYTEEGNLVEEDHDQLPIKLSDFPKGARAGDAFHKIFELIDFKSQTDLISLTSQKVFKEFGFTDESFLSSGIESIEHVLGTKLKKENCDPGFALKDISLENQITEMEFCFPVRSFKILTFQKALELSSSRFQKAGYIQRLNQLDSTDITGFLKGFIDLIVHHDGKWYIVDYKSNYLGDFYNQYNEEKILEAMGEHHYFLQYHVYLVALHRYLTLRQKNYDYDKHFGGIFYLFIRGMHPDFGSRYGLFFDRPSQKSILHLSDNLS